MVKGSPIVHLKITVARDLKGGIYNSEKGYLNPCPGYAYSKAFDVPASTVTVRETPDTTVFPTSAGLALSATQKQFFNTKIAELNKLDQELTTRIEGNTADLPELRQFLMRIVRSADQDLSTTEGQFREQILKSPGKPVPAFFADLHKQYQVLLSPTCCANPRSGQRIPRASRDDLPGSWYPESGEADLCAAA